jgi:hypothetical protein
MLRAILVAWVMATPALAAQPVEGRVVNAVTGAGIQKATVRIFQADDGPANALSVSTDSQGRFRIESMEVGAYRVMYEAPGFRGVPEPGEIAPMFQVGSGAEPVLLEVKMQQLGKLSGRVLDAAGEPVSNADVWLATEGWQRGPASCFGCYPQSKTDENGVFTFRDLEPGRWVLSASAPPLLAPPKPDADRQLGWAQTFFPGVADPQTAEAVTVRPGDQWNPDLKLAAAPVHRVRGRILDPRSHPVSKASVALGKGFGPTRLQETNGNGTFEFASVVDDEWRLSAVVDEGGVKLKAAQWIRVKDRDLENIEVRLAEPFSLRVRIAVEVPEGAAVSRLSIPPLELNLGTALPTDRAFDGSINIRGPHEGELTVPNVYPGTYQLRQLGNSPVPYYLDSIRLGDADALGLFSIVSDNQPLIITYKLGGGTVHGTVEKGDSSHVFLIPEDPDLRRSGFAQVTECDRNGRFEFSAVRPGGYYGLAIAGSLNSFADIYEDTGLLRQASRVMVRPNESTSTEIRLIAR